MKLKIILIFLTSLTLSIAQAQDQIWDLQSCIQYALENNIQVKQSELNRAQSLVNLKGAKFSRLPSLNGNSAYTFSNGRSINPFTNVIVEQAIQSQNYGLNSSVTVFNYLSINNTIKKSNIDLKISEYNLEDQKNLTTLNVITFYTNVLLNAEQVKNAEFSLENTQRRLSEVEKRFEVGATAEQDVLQVKQQLAVDEVNLVRAENAYQFAKLTLQQAMQLPVTDGFQIARPEIVEPSSQFVIESKESVYNQALQTQANIKSADASVESTALDVKINEASYYPSITLSGGLSTNYSSAAPDSIQQEPFTYRRQLESNRRSFLSINLNIPIFNGFQARNSVQLAKINQSRAKLSADNVKNQLRQNIEQAYQDANAAAKSYESSKKQVNALEDSFKNVELRRGLGSATEIEYNQIKNDLNSAKSDLTRTKYDYIFKLKILDFYQGKPLSF